MNLRRLSVAYRSILCFGLLATLSTSLGLFGLSQMSNVRNEGYKIESKSVPSILDGNNLALTILRIRLEIFRLIAVPYPDSQAQSLELIKTLNAQVTDTIEHYRSLAPTEVEIAHLAALKTSYERYLTTLGKINEFLAQKKLFDARQLITNDIEALGDQMSQATEALQKLNQAEVSQAADQSASIYARSKQITFAVIALVLSCTLFLAWRLTVGLSRPIATAVDAAKTIALGDFSKQLDVAGTDEAAQLLQAMHSMQAMLRSTFTEINASANHLADATAMMSASMAMSSQDLQRQSAEIEMAATAVNEMSQAVDEVATTASATLAATRQTAQATESGRLELDCTVESIAQLTKGVIDASGQAQSLATKTQNINKVLNVIRSVAEQTNLLALNAAIEAARAGEAGRGFAVVADEVRGLAQRTGDSTREIETIIQSIQVETGQTVDALQASALHAQETQKKALAVRTSMGLIRDSVSEIDERNLVIASAAEEQSQVAREVDKGLVKIRDLAVQTSISASQTQTSSEDLQKLADALTNRTRKFKL